MPVNVASEPLKSRFVGIPDATACYVDLLAIQKRGWAVGGGISEMLWEGEVLWAVCLVHEPATLSSHAPDRREGTQSLVPWSHQAFDG